MRQNGGVKAWLDIRPRQNLTLGSGVERAVACVLTLPLTT